MISKWTLMRAADFIDFNPRLSIKKGTMATKIAMDKIQPYTKKILDTEKAIFTGGSKFCNGDTIMARITPCLENGKTAFVDVLDDNEVAFGSTEFIVLRAKDGISDPQFIYYLAISPFFRNVAIKSMVGSDGRQRVQQGVLNELEICVPSLEEQKKIGALLASLDQKIAVNNEINNNLHQQYIAIVDQVLCELKEYEIKPLSAVADCQNGRAFYKEGYSDNGAFVIDLGNVNTSGNFVFTNTDKYVSMSRYYDVKLEPYRVYKNDLVMVMTDRKSTMELLGKVGKIYKSGHYLLNQRMYRIRAKNGINTNYLYAYLNSTEVCNALKQKALGSVQKYVNTGDINNIEVKVPSRTKMEEISAVLDPIFLQMETNILQNEFLTELRDLLIPKLISGDIDVSSIQL